MASTRPVCGIDLGTTTSAATVYIPATEHRPAQVSMIKLGKVGDTIPSVVCRSSSTKIWKAGDNAVSEVERDRVNTPLITRSKRLVGMQYADVEKRVLEQMTLVREGKKDGNLQGRPVFAIGDDEISPEAAGAEILMEIMRLADKTLDKHGADKKKVMVTIPAYFTAGQLEAMHQMLRLAGLETYPESFAREPTAALASWYEGEASPEKYSWFLVFDLGGGTLDISIMYQQAKHKLTVAGKNGNMFLGGEDFDDAMRKLVLDSFKRDHPSALEPSAAKVAELQRACKVAKETFQEDPDLQVQTVTIASFCRSPAGDEVTLDVNVSRDAYDDALSGLVEACMKTVDDAIKITEKATAPDSDVRSECPPFDRNKLDKVLMVGGSSRMLLVQASLRNVFGEKVEVLDRPEEAVARGAALIASISEAKQSGQNEHGVYALSIAESLPIGIGFKVYDVTTGRHHMQIVLPAGTPFGRTKSNNSCYVTDTSFVFTVLQGNRDDYDGLAECIVVQKFQVERPGWKSGARRIDLHIEFHVMMDGGLSVTIKPPNKEDAQECEVRQEDLHSRDEQARKELEALGHRHREEQERLRAIEYFYQLLVAGYQALMRAVEAAGESALTAPMRHSLGKIEEFVTESKSRKIADLDKADMEVYSEMVKDLQRELSKRKRDSDEQDSDQESEDNDYEAESGDEDDVDVEGSEGDM